ncbi:MAG: DUF167 domain-containing protein [Burkholderiales bacterium]|nr:DUF167 domain-containing protein [Burkholderiales bacterium]
MTRRWPCLRALGGNGGEGCVLDVSVSPNAKRTCADGLHDGALRVRLAAPPADGKANEALVAWLADALRCARRDVRLLRGHSARRKQIALALPADRVADWLDASAMAERRTTD